MFWQESGSDRLSYVEPSVVLHERLQALLRFDLHANTNLWSSPVETILHDAVQDPPMDALDIRRSPKPVQGRHLDPIGINLIGPHLVVHRFILNAGGDAKSKLLRFRILHRGLAFFAGCRGRHADCRSSKGRKSLNRNDYRIGLMLHAHGPCSWSVGGVAM